MALYDFPSILFTVPHVLCQEDKRGGIVRREAPKNVRVIIAEVGIDKPVLLVCDTVDGNFIEQPPSVIAQVALAEDPQMDVEIFSSLLKVSILLAKIQTFHLVFSTSSEFWDFTHMVAEIQVKRMESQAKEEELVRSVFGMVPSVPRVFKEEEKE